MRKPPLLPTALTLIGLAILCTLGTWQLQRLTWKQNLIEKLETAYAATNPQNIDLSKPQTEFTYGKIKGTFLTGKAFLIGPPQIRDERPGYRLIVPLKQRDHTILINMGWTPHPLEEQPIYNRNNKTVEFHGLLRKSSWNAFTPPNTPEDNIWYRLDIQQISGAKELQNLSEFYLLADQSNYKFDGAFFNDAADNRPMPNNNHLQYAFFWFAMAGALLIIYVLRFVKKP